MSNLRAIRSGLERAKSAGDTFLVLYHLNINGMKGSIDRETSWDDAETASVWALESARRFAGGLGSPQKFLLAAYLRDDEERRDPVTSITFRAAPDVASEMDASVSEPPTSEGLLAQLMRHNQEMHRQTNGMFSTITMHMARTIERQSEQIEKMVRERNEAMVVAEELISKKHQRDIEAKQMEASVEFKKDMYGKVMQLLPIAVNKLAGKEIVRQKDTALEATAIEFVSTLTPTKLDALAQSGLLDRNQLLLLTTVLEQASKRLVTVDEKAKLKQEAELAKLGGLE